MAAEKNAAANLMQPSLALSIFIAVTYELPRVLEYKYNIDEKGEKRKWYLFWVLGALFERVGTRRFELFQFLVLELFVGDFPDQCLGHYLAEFDVPRTFIHQ